MNNSHDLLTKKAANLLMFVVTAIGLFLLITNFNQILDFYFSPVIPKNITDWSDDVSSALFIIASIYLIADAQKKEYFKIVAYVVAIVLLIIIFSCTASWLVEKLNANTVGHDLSYYFRWYTLIISLMFGLSWSLTANQEFSKGLIKNANPLFLPVATGIILMPFGQTYGLLVGISLLVTFYSINKVVCLMYRLYIKINYYQ